MFFLNELYVHLEVWSTYNVHSLFLLPWFQLKVTETYSTVDRRRGQAEYGQVVHLLQQEVTKRKELHPRDTYKLTRPLLSRSSPPYTRFRDCHKMAEITPRLGAEVLRRKINVGKMFLSETIKSHPTFLRNLVLKLCRLVIC